MNWKEFLEVKRYWLIGYVVLTIAVVSFMVAMCDGSQVEPGPPTPTYTRTEYGLWANDARLLYLGTPEEMGVVWAVVVALDGSGPVYRYFEAETDAWTFYSMLRMTLVGGTE